MKLSPENTFKEKNKKAFYQWIHQKKTNQALRSKTLVKRQHIA